MSDANINQRMQQLSDAKSAWAKLELRTKLTILKELKSQLFEHAFPLGQKSAGVKGLAKSKAGPPMEFIAYGVLIMNYLNRLVDTYQELVSYKRCPKLPVRTLPNGQLAVKVCPIKWSDKYQILAAGLEADLYIQPGKPLSQGSILVGEEQHEGRVCVVLGAGNQAFLGLKDILYCLFERNEVVAFKPHPLHEESCQLLEAVLKPLLKVNAVAVVPCDIPSAQQLIYHPLVDAVHMTGGSATHDAIAWGPTVEEQARRKAADDPLLKVPFTSELGCVTPFIVTPGKWTAAELQLHARHIAVAAIMNAGCNCVAAKVVLLAGDWEQRQEFVRLVKAAITETSMQPCYYPGIFARYDAWKAQYPDAEPLVGPEEPSSVPVDRYLPVLFKEMEGPPSCPEDEYAFKVEPFAPTLVVLSLPTSGAEDFLQQAVSFSNKHLWGDLTCTLLVHPDTEKHHKAAVDTAVLDLKYGVVAVNSWSVISMVLATTPWGGFNDPAKSLKDVRSGIGLAGNPYMVDHVQKAVVKVPFMGMAVPQPPHLQPVPMAAAKAMVGYVYNGFSGMCRGLMKGE